MTNKYGNSSGNTCHTLIASHPKLRHHKVKKKRRRRRRRRSLKQAIHRVFLLNMNSHQA